MRWLALLTWVIALGSAAAQGNFNVLGYHEVRDDVREYPDAFAVDTTALVRQLEWLRGNGYTPVSLDEILAARSGQKPLPPKAIVLTFDDAYLSFYTHVLPLLREFRFPAILGVVGSWIDDPAHAATQLYGPAGTANAASFPTWGQLREIANSGLVDIASHSYDLHHGVLGNPQGNHLPAATTRVYDPATGAYESDAAWQARVHADLARNSSRIELETGRRPRVMVWPYGSHNGELVRIAGELGMPVALTLDDGANTPEIPLAAVQRSLMQHNPELVDFSLEARGPLRPAPVRVIQVSLDSIYQADPAQQEVNLSQLLDRIQILRPTHVWLEAGTDNNGDGIIDAAYFRNRHLPVRADFFNRVAWQLSSRLGVKVYASLAVAGLQLPPEQILEVYEDLARHAYFNGLFMTDGSAEFTQQIVDRVSRWRAIRIARSHANASLASADTRSDFVVLPMPATPEAISTSPRVIYMPDNDRVVRQMRELQLNGALNFGFRGADLLRDQPRLRIAPVMSLRIHPR